MLDRIKEKLGIRKTVEDVEPDPNIARTRRTGGGDTENGDSASTTGTGRSDEFVGEIAGQDAGADEESGAERRAGD